MEKEIHKHYILDDGHEKVEYLTKPFKPFCDCEHHNYLVDDITNQQIIKHEVYFNFLITNSFALEGHLNSNELIFHKYIISPLDHYHQIDTSICIKEDHIELTWLDRFYNYGALTIYIALGESFMDKLIDKYKKNRIYQNLIYTKPNIDYQQPYLYYEGSLSTKSKQTTWSLNAENVFNHRIVKIFALYPFILKINNILQSLSIKDLTPNEIYQLIGKSVLIDELKPIYDELDQFLQLNINELSQTHSSALLALDKFHNSVFDDQQNSSQLSQWIDHMYHLYRKQPTTPIINVHKVSYNEDIDYWETYGLIEIDILPSTLIGNDKLSSYINFLYHEKNDVLNKYTQDINENILNKNFIDVIISNLEKNNEYMYILTYNEKIYYTLFLSSLKNYIKKYLYDAKIFNIEIHYPNYPSNLNILELEYLNI